MSLDQMATLSSREDLIAQQLREYLPQLGIGEFTEVGVGRHICAKGSTHVDVRLMKFGDQVAVRSQAPVAVDTTVTIELLKFLLLRNAGFLFGAFGLEMWRGHTVVMFSHTILASSLDANELGSSVTTVIEVADRYDDAIVEKWGGRTMAQVRSEELIPRRVLSLLKGEVLST